MIRQKHSLKLAYAVPCILLLSACNTTGTNYRADVYQAGQVNQTQEVKTVDLIAVMPAQVEVDNSAARQQAQIGAGLIGALAGSVIGNNSSNQYNTYLGGAAGGAAGAAAGTMTPSNALVDGVSLTYTLEGKTYNSAQVGRMCEYQPGTAILVSQTQTETRIQPNAQCAMEQHS